MDEKERIRLSVRELVASDLGVERVFIETRTGGIKQRWYRENKQFANH
jgi:hypothetical protein